MAALSIGVPFALELLAVRKCFAAGAGACHASAEVLRGVDLEVHAGESLAVIGASAAGKSTLMLCAAGLLRPDSGQVKWFGDSSRAAAARHVQYYCTAAELRRPAIVAEPQIHLVDLHMPLDAGAMICEWTEERCADGDSVIIVAREELVVRRAVNRVLTLAGGILRSPRAVRARVAEHAG